MTSLALPELGAAIETPRRFFHLRDVEWADSGNGKDYTFEGSAVVFNAWSETLYTPRGAFKERFLPGAFARVLAGTPDVRFLKNHDKNLVLARTRAGTLELEETDQALRVWARVAKTSYATDLRLSMDRGDIDQMSLQFEMDFNAGAEERWYENKRTGEVCHDVVRASGLIDVSVVTFPAYVETEAIMRELDRAVERGALPQALRRDHVVISGAVPKPPADRGASGERAQPPRRYLRCAQVVAETPWAILPSSLALILSILRERAGGYKPSTEEIRGRVGVRRDNSPAAVGEIAVIPLVGPIFSRAGAMQEISGAKSIDDFRAQFRQALNDPAVSAIVLDIDSPGGSAAGTPEMAAEIYAARDEKPIVAVANTMAASAAYWIGCAASEFYCSTSGEVGSIGVYAAHEDISKWEEMKGFKTTLVHAGEYKVEGNPFEPLTEQAQAAIQSDVDTIYENFLGAVAKYRGVDKDAVRADYGQGRCVMAAEAAKLGMVDGVKTIDQVLERLASGTHARSRDSLQAAAIPPHSTDVVDEPWDGPAATSACKAERGPLRALHAWVDSDANPALKGSYKFPHHEVSADGDPGAANVNGVRNALARLPGSNVPAADKPGVERHLQRHLDDFQQSQGDSAQAMVESRESLREALGLVVARANDPAGSSIPSAAPATVDAKADPVAVLKRASREAKQRAKETLIRLTKETLK